MNKYQIGHFNNIMTDVIYQTFEGHTGSISAVTVTPDVKCVVSTSINGMLKVWDLETGIDVAGFSGDGLFITCAISWDRATIIAGDELSWMHFLQLK